MSMLYVYACILVPRNVDLGFLLCCLFRSVLIICLGLIKCSFHMFSTRVSRITCFTCLIDILVIRVYALMNHINIHENLNMH